MSKQSKKKPNRKHVGSSFDEFLVEEGLFEEVTAIATKRVIAWKLSQAMRAKNISKSALAERMHTSRPVVDRLLDETVGVTLDTISRAANVLGLRPTMDFIEIEQKVAGVEAPRAPAKKRSAPRVDRRRVAVEA